MKRFSLTLALLFTLLILSTGELVHAQSSPSCSVQQDGSIVCVVSGGGNNGGGNDGGGGNGGQSNTGNDAPGACTPGQHVTYQINSYDAGTGMCQVSPINVDNCTGQIISTIASVLDMPCETQAQTPQHPCTVFSVGSGGITCTNTEWNVSARVTFPEIYLDVRPYPVTLVRWPTAVRNGGQPESSGSGGRDYISYGGGSKNNPREGDWQNLRLTLTLRPAGPMFVTLPKIGELMLTDQGPTGTPTIIQWEVPSHPAVGGGPMARTVSGLDELPADMPLFVGKGHATYKLFWELRYYEYQAIKECVDGPNANGNYNCGGGTGHKVIVDYEWKRKSSGGEIPPSAVKDLPAALKADLNGDGTADAYWDNKLTLRRMDDNNRVDNPQYQRSWNWGGMIYWAVREGQGQIGWPGQ
jgi:hypothetical protein